MTQRRSFTCYSLVVMLACLLMACPEPKFSLVIAILGGGTTDPAPGTYQHTKGDTVAITASASPGWHFDHWEGGITGSANPASITVNQNTLVTAVFALNPVLRTLTVEVNGAGSVSPVAGAHQYNDGATVTLEATPASGWHFDHWEGALSGSANPTSLVMNADKTVSAVFRQDPAPPATLPLIVGMEYAFPGLGAGLAALRLPAVKFMPDIIGWDKMQVSADAPIDFTLLDRLVAEYQNVGFTEAIVGLKSESAWASIAPNASNPSTNFAPKPEYMDDYAAWIGAIVERYDMDSVNDMPGLRRPIRYYEIGVEFSSFEPEPVGDYLAMLATAYQAAHLAYPNVVVMHAAFLTTTAFITNPGPDEYEAAFAAVDTRILYHSLADIRAVLDRPDLFDAVNFHCLAGPREVEATTAWLRYETGIRGYNKPLVISDTSPSPFIGWGLGTLCTGNPNSLGIVIAPATEADRCRLAQYFTLLVNSDAATLDWLHGFVAGDIVRMVVAAAEQGIHLIDTTFMEDLVPLQAPIFFAAAGNSAWSGMVESTVNLFTQQHSITGYRPLFYALQQLISHMDNYNAIERVETGDAGSRLYRLMHTGALGLPDLWMAWYDPGQLILPGDAVPATTLRFATSAPKVIVETLISQPAQTIPESTTLESSGGTVEIPLTIMPVFISPAP